MTTDPWLEQFNARRAEREQAKQTVELLGETLLLKPSVAPQVTTRYFDSKIRRLRYAIDRDEAIQKKQQPPPLPEDLYDAVLLDLFEDTARACIAPESIEAWERIRSPEQPNPLTWHDLMDLCEYLMGRASGLPTEGPTDSSTGPRNGKATSKDASSSPAKRSRR